MTGTCQIPPQPWRRDAQPPAAREPTPAGAWAQVVGCLPGARSGGVRAVYLDRIHPRGLSVACLTVRYLREYFSSTVMDAERTSCVDHLRAAVSASLLAHASPARGLILPTPNPEPEINEEMQYELAALIARPPVLLRVQLAYPAARVVLLAQGLALTPLVNTLTVALAAGGGKVPPDTGFTKLSPGLLALLTSTSRVGPIGLFEASYVGIDGWQTAAVWHAGELAYGPDMLDGTEPFPDSGDGPFGRALRTLGASPEGQYDTFVAVGLDQIRRTEDWGARSQR